MKPIPLDPVTVVLPDSSVILAWWFGTLPGHYGIHVLYEPGPPFMPHPIFGLEGVAWLRGWHAVDAEPVLACRAAQALVHE